MKHARTVSAGKVVEHTATSYRRCCRLRLFLQKNNESRYSAGIHWGQMRINRHGAGANTDAIDYGRRDIRLRITPLVVGEFAEVHRARIQTPGDMSITSTFVAVAHSTSVPRKQAPTVRNLISLDCGLMTSISAPAGAEQNHREDYEEEGHGSGLINRPETKNQITTQMN